jgi:hypothetical protein
MFRKPPVFANLHRLISPRTPHDYDAGFVQEVRVRGRPPRNIRLERLLVAGWILIAIKSVVVVWAVRRYHVPFSPLWVIVPTVVFAALCTGVYLRRK